MTDPINLSGVYKTESFLTVEGAGDISQKIRPSQYTRSNRMSVNFTRGECNGGR